MKDMFAELMAYLFAENRRNTSMPPPYRKRLLSSIKSCIQKNNTREDDRTDEK